VSIYTKSTIIFTNQFANRYLKNFAAQSYHYKSLVIYKLVTMANITLYVSLTFFGDN